MDQSPAAWSEKCNKCFVKFLLVDGILLKGGPFAVILQVIGYFLLADEGADIWAVFYIADNLDDFLFSWYAVWRNHGFYQLAT